MKRFTYPALVGLLSFSLSGCLVAESRYLNKVEEAYSLSKELGNLKQQHAALIASNAAIKAEYDKLKEEAAGWSRDKLTLQKDKKTLSKDKAELEKILKAKSDTFSQNISDLRQKIAALETANSNLDAANRKMNNDIANLQKAKEEKVKEVSGTYEQLLQDMKSEIATGQVTVSELNGKLTIKMGVVVLFDSGKADIKPSGMAILTKIVETLKAVKERAIRIEGRTDNVQITGTLTRQFLTKWELSAARAINVTQYLQQQGLDPAILSAIALAEYNPVADNGNKDGRARIRRIDIIVVAKD